MPSAGGAKGLRPLDSWPSAGSGRALPCTRACAASGRALPCTRDFFVKKSSKNFISPAGGIKTACKAPLRAISPVK
ncbi:hypothetical protein D3Z52_10020 [Clostridiaceae bacterium]|nr:hypothetical protein [Clostridiaceae bacterium]